MNKLELSPRLAAIAALVPQGARLADVGTDHAYLPVRLLLDGGIASVVATDVNEGPLQRGRETAERYGMGTILFRRCDGLADIRADEVDTVVIAGMGGDLIARILAAAPWTKQAHLILQPMTAQEDLRRWLLENGYRIAKETLAQEGKKLYVILSATGGSSTPYTPGELLAVAYNAGQEVGRHALHTAGPVAALRVTATRDTLPADGQSLVYLTVDTVDARGRWNRWDSTPVRISVEGAGQLLGFGSAAPSSEESYQATAADTWDGRVMAVIRSTAQPGALRVRFVADSCPDTLVTLTAVPVQGECEASE